MRQTAQMLDVFNSATYDDKDGAKTRWNDTPTAFLILLRRAPDAGHIEFLNGERVPFHHGPFNYPLALALHRNAVRVPRYLVHQAMPNQPTWLGKNIQDAVLAVIHDDATCELIGSADAPPYLLEYRDETGLSHTRNAAPSLTSTLDPCDDWF